MPVCYQWRARVSAFAFGLCSFLSPTFAEPVLPEVVVTATRTATRADDVVRDVVVIMRDRIESEGGRTLPEVLARQAGLQISANGGRGKQSSVFIRGTESRHVLLLVDGVRVGSATSGTASWESIPLDVIERIEVLKGPASSLYGSDAVGGVVQVFTRKGREGFHPSAAITAGSYGHVSADLAASGGRGPLSYSFGVQRVRETGFSATNARVPNSNYNPDIDPFGQTGANGNITFDLGQGWKVDAGAFYSDGVTWFDEGPLFDSRSALRSFTGSLGLRGQLSSDWVTSLRFWQGNDTSDTIVSRSPGAFRTEQREWSWQNEVATAAGTVVGGLEQRRQAVSGSTAYVVRERTIGSAFAGISGSSGPQSWQVNLRRDENSQFGGATTWYGGYGFKFARNWRAAASAGTSFVAPSFNQLYFPGFGNPALQPEKGRNQEVALAWAEKERELKLVRFVNRIRGFQTNTTLPQNIPRARIDGWSVTYSATLSNISTHGSLDLLAARNEMNGRLLPRRARQQATFGADWRSGALQLGLEVLAASKRFDDAANTRTLNGYATTDLVASWRMSPALVIQGRLNNLADRRYETAYGYNQPGRALFVTLRWQER